MRLRKWMTAGVAALAIAGVAGCGSGSSGAGAATVPAPVSAADLAKVTLKVGDQKGGSKSLLTAANLLGDVPYKIEWSTFTSGPPLLEAASAGAIDIGGVGNTPPIFAAAANAKVAAVSMAKGNVESDALLVPSDSPLHQRERVSRQDHRRRQGKLSAWQILLTLKKAGLSTKDVKLSFLQPSEAYAAFNQHQIDAWATWDPYTSQAGLESKARVLVDGTGVANGYTFEVAGTNALADAGTNAAIRDFVVRIAKAQQWANTHRSAWADAWAKETGLKLDVANKAVNTGPDLPVPLDDQVVTSEQNLADAFTDDKSLPGKVNFAKFMDLRFATDLNAIRSN
jgi:sulfonate transport system substrate-binding protein